MNEGELLKLVVEADKSTSAVRGWLLKNGGGSFIHALHAKHIKAGTWVKFLKRNLPGISSATTYRYFELAREYPDPGTVPENIGLRACTELLRC